ncbi:type II toxin-antitoxin system PemK/MazF family toxin [Massilimicrobiota sp. An80]|uniref:type II toxin-antitoxin system PemK/MazF family toxin n=2 Tax=Erysipelotrichaceae TaxID=128827 RepID=UPI000B446D22|nr:type II toxin-antitoxin system PemK/MazF family toxin [Massilimicrobiota sp. An80]OUN29308.1 hypothetical protein B5G32_13325 [Massilimicrobiota sp. An80]
MGQLVVEIPRRKKVMKRGEIYFANLSPTMGSEQGGIRPVLIIQNDKGNVYSPTVIIAPISSSDQKRKKKSFYHVDLDIECLPKRSFVMLEQIRTIDKKRLDNYIGCVDEKFMKIIDRGIILSMVGI